MKKTHTLLFMSSLKFRDIELNLVQLIKKKKNLSSIFVVNTEQEKDFYLKKFSKYIDKIIVLPNEFDFLNKNNFGENIQQEALKLEKKYKMTINRIFLEDRTIGRGFHSTGGINHPETKLSKVTHKEILYLAVNRINFWEQTFKKYNVKLTLNLAPSVAILAKSMKIKTFNLNIAKFEKRLLWSQSPSTEPDRLVKEFKKNKNIKCKEVEIKDPHYNHAILRRDLIKMFSYKDAIILSIRSFLQSIKGNIKGHRKGKNIVIFSELSYIWRRRREYYYLKKIINTNLSNIRKKKIKYIYFPLVTEPETSLHGIAYDFFFQLAAIQMISRDLPANFKLVVKEHLPAIGRRPKDFYKQIIELKNVLIADPLEYGISYINHSSAVALVTGTAGWEASAIGVPVISFSKYNTYNFLDHVYYVNNPDETASIINKIIEKQYPNKKSIRDGALMYYSYRAISVESKNRIPFTSWERAKNSLTDKKLLNKLYKDMRI